MASATKAPGAAADLRWVTGATLASLAARGKGTGDTFTRADMRDWMPQITENGMKTAINFLISGGFITRKAKRLKADSYQTFSVYTITATGAAAIQAAAGGKVPKSGPKGPRSRNRAPKSQSYVVRLWALMRARKMLDTESAAETLMDAGGDFDKAVKTTQCYFQRWASTGAIEESRQRLPNGRKRFVLVNDCGPVPPTWTAKPKARNPESAAA